MSEKVLFVDDDPNILAAFQRQLRRHFSIEISTDAAQSLESLDTNGPYAVIVSDMRMPGMDGVQFLRQVRTRAPDTVRIMLTGNADQRTAADAVNEGAIFRFLTKPCSIELLIQVLTAAIGHYRLATAEKDLLEKTLRGSVKVLTEILGLINPIAFSRTARIQKLVNQLAERLKLANRWQLDLAAMLSQIGCVTLLPHTLEAVNAGESLPPEEAQRYAAHPKVASHLLASIPRLEAVAEIIERQNEPFDPHKFRASPKDRDPIAAAAQVLKVAIHFDRLLARGIVPHHAVKLLLERPTECDPGIVSFLEQIDLPECETDVQVVHIRDLATLMILDEDVRTKNGSLIVTSGQTVTYALLERLRNFWSHGSIADRLRVRVPKMAEDSASPAAISARVTPAQLPLSPGEVAAHAQDRGQPR